MCVDQDKNLTTTESRLREGAIRGYRGCGGTVPRSHYDQTVGRLHHILTKARYAMDDLSTRSDTPRLHDSLSNSHPSLTLEAGRVPRMLGNSILILKAERVGQVLAAALAPAVCPKWGTHMSILVVDE